MGVIAATGGSSRRTLCPYDLPRARFHAEAIAGCAVGEAVAVAEVVDGVAVEVAAVAAGAGAKAGPAAELVPDPHAVGAGRAGSASVAERAGSGEFAAVGGGDAAKLGVAADEGHNVDDHGVLA